MDLTKQEIIAIVGKTLASVDAWARTENMNQFLSDEARHQLIMMIAMRNNKKYMKMAEELFAGKIVSEEDLKSLARDRSTNPPDSHSE